jgi:hypothetical protein
MVMEQMVEERESRLFQRFPARFPVKFKHSREEFSSDVFLRDASAQGLRLTSRKRMFLHDSVALLVSLPDGKEPLTLNGRVVWTKTKGQDLWDVGLEFHKINLMNLHRIFHLIMPEE